MINSISPVKRQMYSSSSSEDDDEDWNERNSKKKKQIRGRPVKKVARPTIKDSDDDDEEIDKEDIENDKEEGEVDDGEEDVDDEDEDDEFNDGYDENLMGDEEDQKRLLMMTEKEREQELFNRSEKREVLKTRFEIEKKLRLAKKKEQNKSFSDVQYRSIDRRKVLESNRKQKDGLKALKEQREKRKQKAKLRASDVYSSSSSDEEDDVKRKSSSSESSESSSDDDSDNDRRRKSDDDFDLGKKEKLEIPFVFNINELNGIRVSRFKLSQWCHTPFFKDTVIGCFVRLSIGVNKDKTPVYRVAEIVDIIQGSKIYDLEKTKTDKLLKLKHGGDEKNFRIEYVSNTEFTDKEFIDWKNKMDKERLNLPGRKQVEDRKKSIHTAINYNFNEADIEAIVKEKEKYKELPVNFAMRKTHLKKQKDMAEQLGDHVEVERISQLLEDIEEKAKELDHKRTQSISAISYINERNRMKNIVEAEKAILEARELDKQKQGDEPFKRRKCAPMLVSMVKRQDNGKFNKNDTLNLSVNNSIMNNSTSNLGNTSLNSLNKTPIPNSKLISKESSPSNHDEQSDLFSAHDFDIQIDFDISSGLNTNSNNGINNSLYSSNLSTSNLVSNKTSRRSLNLEEYKKKKGLI